MSRSTPPVPPATPAASTAAPTPAPQSAPLFTVEDLAQLFHLEVDSVREFTYRSDFPQPIKIGRRWLWFPDEVLTWTRQQPRFSVADRKRNSTQKETAAPTPEVKAYKARTPKNEGAAA